MMKKIFDGIKIVAILSLLAMLIQLRGTAIFICLFMVILLFVCDGVKKRLRYSDAMQLLIYLFLIGSLLLGEVYHYYEKLWYFDVILHLLSSFIVTGLAQALLKVGKCKMNMFMEALFAFSFAMMVAVLWEVTEFSIDRFMLADMQKDTLVSNITSEILAQEDGSLRKVDISEVRINDEIVLDQYIDIGLFDTMEDIVCAIIGSSLYLFWHLLSEKKRKALYEASM